MHFPLPLPGISPGGAGSLTGALGGPLRTQRRLCRPAKKILATPLSAQDAVGGT